MWIVKVMVVTATTTMSEKSKRIWDYLNSITHKKDRSVLQDPDFDKQYQAFVINRALAQHSDCIGAANLMNERALLPAALQFHFLLNTLRPRFRKSDWIKHKDSDDVSVVAEYYDCSTRHARALVTLHTSEQLTYLRKRLEKGGTASKRLHHDTP